MGIFLAMICDISPSGILRLFRLLVGIYFTSWRGMMNTVHILVGKTFAEFGVRQYPVELFIHNASLL